MNAMRRTLLQAIPMLAASSAFAADGAAVVVNSSRSVTEGEAVAASLPDARYVQGDITDPAFPEQFVNAACDANVRVRARSLGSLPLQNGGKP